MALKNKKIIINWGLLSWLAIGTHEFIILATFYQYSVNCRNSSWYVGGYEPGLGEFVFWSYIVFIELMFRLAVAGNKLGQMISFMLTVVMACMSQSLSSKIISIQYTADAGLFYCLQIIFCWFILIIAGAVVTPDDNSTFVDQAQAIPVGRFLLLNAIPVLLAAAAILLFAI